MQLTIHYSLIFTLLLTALPVIAWATYVHAEALPSIGLGMDFLNGMKTSEVIQFSAQELEHELETFKAGVANWLEFRLHKSKGAIKIKM